MKIAVASTGSTEDSMVSNVGGRAPFFLIYENKKLVKTLKNPFMFGGGAGFSVAHLLAKEGVEEVIAGNFGPNMIQALKTKGIKIRVVSNKTVKEAIEEA